MAKLPKSKARLSKRIKKQLGKRDKFNLKKLTRELNRESREAKRISKFSNTVVKHGKKTVSFYKYNKKQSKWKFVTRMKKSKFRTMKKNSFISSKRINAKYRTKMKVPEELKRARVRITKTSKAYRLRGKTTDNKKVKAKVIVTTKKQAKIVTQLSRKKYAPLSYTKGKISSVINLVTQKITVVLMRQSRFEAS